MIGVDQIGSRARGWVEAGRRLATAPSAPAVTAALLGLAAVTESSVRAAVTGLSAQTALVLCLLALASTLPPALLGQPPPRQPFARSACCRWPHSTPSPLPACWSS
jgi:hypothetical protein